MSLGHLLGNVYQQPVLIVKMTYTNATLGRDFLPPANAMPCGALYQRLVQFTSYYTSRPDDYDLVAMVWWQGYSDFAEPLLRQEYRRNLKELIEATRIIVPDIKLVIGELGGQGTMHASRDEQQFRINQRINVDSAHDKQHLRFASTHDSVNDSDVSVEFDKYSIYQGQPLAMLDIGAALAQQLLDLLKADFLDSNGGLVVDKDEREEFEAGLNRLQFVIMAVCATAVTLGTMVGIFMGSTPSSYALTSKGEGDNDEEDEQEMAEDQESNEDGELPINSATLSSSESKQ